MSSILSAYEYVSLVVYVEYGFVERYASESVGKSTVKYITIWPKINFSIDEELYRQLFPCV